MAHYSRKIDEKMEARAMGKELNISHRHAVAVANMIRHKPVESAMGFLEAVIEQRKPVRVAPRKGGHKRGRGFGAGRYPVKAASRFLELLIDVVNNAEQHLGVSSAEDLDIVHVSAQKGSPTKGTIPRARGRATPHNRDSVHIELIVRKREEE